MQTPYSNTGFPNESPAQWHSPQQQPPPAPLQQQQHQQHQQVHHNTMNMLGDMGGLPDVATAALSGGQRIWQGHLFLQGQLNNMYLPVVAIGLHTSQRPTIQSVEGWPAILQCDLSRLKPYNVLLPFMLDNSSQWFVAFSVIDNNANEIVDARFVKLINVLVAQNLAFEIECASYGTLYLWGANNTQHGVRVYLFICLILSFTYISLLFQTSLLGVFRPAPPLSRLSQPPAPLQSIEPVTLSNVAGSSSNTGHLQNASTSTSTAASSLPISSDSSPTAASAVPQTELRQGQIIWRGDLHVKGDRKNMIVPCVARRYFATGKLPIYDASGWPTTILCDSTRIINCNTVAHFINEPTTLWYAKFIPLDENGVEVPNHNRLRSLVRVVVERQYAFEIECNVGTFGHGTLYLWGMNEPGEDAVSYSFFCSHPQIVTNRFLFSVLVTRCVSTHTRPLTSALHMFSIELNRYLYYHFFRFDLFAIARYSFSALFVASAFFSCVKLQLLSFHRTFSLHNISLEA